MLKYGQLSIFYSWPTSSLRYSIVWSLETRNMDRSIASCSHTGNCILRIACDNHSHAVPSNLTSDSSSVRDLADLGDESSAPHRHNRPQKHEQSAKKEREKGAQKRRKHHIPLFTFETAFNSGLYLSKVASNSLFIIVSASSMPAIYAKQPPLSCFYLPLKPSG